MMRHLLAILSVLAFAGAIAADEVVVVKGRDTRTSMTTPAFTGNDAQVAALINSVLTFDLRACGYFKLGSASTELLQLTGKFQSDATQVAIDCVLTRRDKNEVILLRRYSGMRTGLRALCHQIADEIVEAMARYTNQPMIGIAQTKIAFILKRGGASELAVMDYDGHNVTVLTRDNSISARPRWVDGNRIVYMSYKSGWPQVYLVDLASGRRERLTNYPGLNTAPSPSPNGNRLALILSKDGNPELYTMGLWGDGLRRLTRTAGGESSPCWSPDGTRIAYVSDDGGTPQVYVMDAAGGDSRRLTRHATYNTEPDWSPLGERLAVTSRIGGIFQLAIVDAVSGDATILPTGGGDSENPTWAPNGKTIVFGKTTNRRSRLVLMDVDSQEMLNVPGTDGEYCEPAWGPRLRR